jgi:hypothetical protein
MKRVLEKRYATNMIASNQLFDSAQGLGATIRVWMDDAQHTRKEHQVRLK